MISAWINGILGIGLVVGIGELRLGLTTGEQLACIAASNAAALFALFIYSWATRHPWPRRHIVKGPARTWIMFLVSYFGPMLLLAPPLRVPMNFAWLVIPAILTTGFAILLFGPIHDTFVARGRRH